MFYLKKESGSTANFSIILPGECNAACSFCFWKRNAAESPMYAQGLRWYLQALGKRITQISITGGEPTISPVFDEVIEVLREFKEIKIVLTTNGADLRNKLSVIEGVVQHVNISRHAVNDEENYEIFKTSNVPSKVELELLCRQLNELNIDVTINKVIPHNYNDFVEFETYIKFIKDIGASALALRKDYSVNSLANVPLEASLGRVGIKRDCPVCATNSYLYKGIPVHFKMSLEEPSVILPYIYEFIYHPNGLLSEDWAGKKPIEIGMKPDEEIKPTWGEVAKTQPRPYRDYIVSGGCGQSSMRSGC